MDTESKVILAPKTESVESYTIFRIPSPVNLECQFTIMMSSHGSGVYQMGTVSGASLSDDPKVTLNNAAAIKSFIFLGVETANGGYVLQDPHMIVANKFDVTYTILAVMRQSMSIFSNRFISQEDVCDQISSKFNDLSCLHRLPLTLLSQCLERICECVYEGDQVFYKYSEAKAISMIQERVEKLALYISSNPSFSLHNIIRSKIVPPHLNLMDLDPSLISLAVKQYALDLTCDSMTLPDVKQGVIDVAGYNFEPLSLHLNLIQETKRNLQAAEDIMAEFAPAGKNCTTVKLKQTAKSKRGAVKKVAVGKGALDSFLNRS